jgi:hypothetical protein
MTDAAPVLPVIYGHDPSGRPAVTDLAGSSPHVLIAGGTGRGLTTLAGVIAAGAARNGSTVRACLPRGEDGTSESVKRVETSGGLIYPCGLL